MGFSRQEYWSGLQFPSPGDLPDPGIEPGSPALQADVSPSKPPGKPMTNLDSILKSRDIPLPTKVRLVKTMVFPVVTYRCDSWLIKKAEHQGIDAFKLWCWTRLFRVTWIAKRSNQSILKEISPDIHWKDWSWSWNSNTLASWCEELTHWKRPQCWERLKAGGEGDERGWDGWIASLTQWTWVWVSPRNWWWTGKPGLLQSMGLQRVRHDSDWTELNFKSYMNSWAPPKLNMCEIDL